MVTTTDITTVQLITKTTITMTTDGTDTGTVQGSGHTDVGVMSVFNVIITLPISFILTSFCEYINCVYLQPSAEFVD